METMNPPLQERIREAARMLVSYGAREVHLFGSCARGTMDEGSDVDLAVSGLPEEVFYRAVGMALHILGRPVDLVDLDERNPFTESLKTEEELVRVA